MSTAIHLFIKLHKLNQKLWFLYLLALALLIFLETKGDSWSMDLTMNIISEPYRYIYRSFDNRYYDHQPMTSILLTMIGIAFHIGVISFIVGTLQKLILKLKNRHVPKH